MDDVVIYPINLCFLFEKSERFR